LIEELWQATTEEILNPPIPAPTSTTVANGGGNGGGRRNNSGSNSYSRKKPYSGSGYQTTSNVKNRLERLNKLESRNEKKKSNRAKRKDRKLLQKTVSLAVSSATASTSNPTTLCLPTPSSSDSSSSSSSDDSDNKKHKKRKRSKRKEKDATKRFKTISAMLTTNATAMANTVAFSPTTYPPVPTPFVPPQPAPALPGPIPNLVFVPNPVPAAPVAAPAAPDPAPVHAPAVPYPLLLPAQPNPLYVPPVLVAPPVAAPPLPVAPQTMTKIIEQAKRAVTIQKYHATNKTIGRYATIWKACNKHIKNPAKSAGCNVQLLHCLQVFDLPIPIPFQHSPAIQYLAYHVFSSNLTAPQLNVVLMAAPEGPTPNVPVPPNAFGV
jgi:hypothetical protein